MRVLALSLLLAAACFSDPNDGTEGSSGATTNIGTQGGSHSTHGGSAGSTGESGGTTWGTSTAGSTGGPGETSAGSTGSQGDGACVLYCGTIGGACDGDLAQYPSVASCVRACAALPVGEDGAMSGDSLACRRTHADLAIDDPQTHCVHAGPGGAGVCGSNCESFCAIATSICPGEHPELGTCLETCTAWDATEPYDVGDATGDTFACRLYHLMVAATDDPSALTHCAHTLDASPPCK